MVEAIHLLGRQQLDDRNENKRQWRAYGNNNEINVHSCCRAQSLYQYIHLHDAIT